ncbi:protein of unknown function [Candidatus Filomicrobium marinum]|uniref:Uncharacterized protein n=1 Tax=Candidatus Filomicrobium marinum TaxID=1608628 RepID=A0A0D6J9T4_9HYPH|nr:protein of unknown function [Candidatus Filomicrobium marinum]CPR15029.1 protein of unknown function [Candidatus Filomicrobium marinum]
MMARAGVQQRAKVATPIRTLAAIFKCMLGVPVIYSGVDGSRVQSTSYVHLCSGSIVPGICWWEQGPNTNWDWVDRLAQCKFLAILRVW